MTLTEEQLEIRRKGITATDMTKIMGVSNYGGPIDVLMDKRGTPAPFTMTERVKWGNILEAPIRQDYANRHEVDMLEPGTLKHPDEEWALATPDGIVLLNMDRNGNSKPARGWEAKTHTSWMSHLYGEPGSDDVPEWELIQCCWNLYVARAFYNLDITRWDLTVFMDGVPVDYVIHRDEELEEILVDAGRAFWFDHVVGGKELAPDGSESYAKHLKRKWTKNGEIFVAADSEAMDAIEALRDVRGEIKGLEAEKEHLAQFLQAKIEGNAGIEWDGGKITWRHSKASKATSWKAIVQALQKQAKGKNEAFAKHLTKLIESNSKPKAVARPFVVPKTWNK